MFNELKVNPSAEPVQTEASSIIAEMAKLYDTLCEIEASTSRLGTSILGLPRAEMCAGTPDSLGTHIHMALSLANVIRDELNMIHISLGD